jgi:dienelactone hydrolase
MSLLKSIFVPLAIPAVPPITPSSAGIRFEPEIYYAEDLARAGVAALLIDCFGSQGVSKPLTRWEAAHDAVGLRWLHGYARFKKDRIGVLGVSRAGSLRSLMMHPHYLRARLCTGVQLWA